MLPEVKDIVPVRLSIGDVLAWTVIIKVWSPFLFPSGGETEIHEFVLSQDHSVVLEGTLTETD